MARIQGRRGPDGGIDEHEQSVIGHLPLRVGAIIPDAGSIPRLIPKRGHFVHVAFENILSTHHVLIVGYKIVQHVHYVEQIF